MVRRIPGLLLFFVSSVLVAQPRPHTQTASRYLIKDLGAPGGDASDGVAIDDTGRVVGTITGSRDRAFMYDGTRVVHLDTIARGLANRKTYAAGISTTNRM